MPDALIPRLTNLSLARYAPGWGHPPGVLERAIRSADARELKTTTLPHTETSLVSVFSLRLEIPTGSKRETTPHEVVLKVNPLIGLLDRAKGLLGRSKHHRQWRGAETLARHGIETAMPLALLRGRCEDQGFACEVLLLPKLSGCTLLELMARPGGADPALANKLGEQLAKYARAGLWNRDPKPSNVLVREDGELVWLDTVGVGYRRGPDHAFVRHAVKMLLLECRGVGHDCPEEFAQRVVASATGAGSDRTGVLLKEIRMAADSHGDPTPTDDPLRRTSG